MTPSKELAADYLRKQGYEVKIISGIVVVYDADYKIIRRLLHDIGYTSSFGVSRREHADI